MRRRSRNVRDSKYFSPISIQGARKKYLISISKIAKKSLWFILTMDNFLNILKEFCKISRRFNCVLENNHSEYDYLAKSISIYLLFTETVTRL